MAEALKRVKLTSGFCPTEIGAKIGLSKPQSEAAARALSNAGVFVLGFDLAAHFSPAFRKTHGPDVKVSEKKKARKTAKRARAAAAAV
ncbi:MAG TPA: hypothetical protein VN670_11165 [Acidobacteriaceae bacterium]|nr:hypothetical protein [Acidobacteriaceae bacterium]